MLAGVGIDIERIDRFSRPGDDANPLPMVLSECEVARARAAADTARMLCAAFGLKEAFFKAVRRPFDPMDVRWVGPVDGVMRTVDVGSVTLSELGLSGAVARAFQHGDACVVEVFVFRGVGASPDDSRIRAMEG